MLAELLPAFGRRAATRPAIWRRSARRPRCKAAETKKPGRSEAYEQFRDAANELRDAIEKVSSRHMHSIAEGRGRRPQSRVGPALAWPPASAAHTRPEEAGAGRAGFQRPADPRPRPARRARARADCASGWPARSRLLLVDEFQDTDPLQVELVKALCDNELTSAASCFFVGDYKQSIYRFRGADPHVFRRLRAGDSRGGPAAAVAELPQPAGGAGVRQRAVLRRVGARLRAAASASPAGRPAPAVEFLWASTRRPTDRTERQAVGRRRSCGAPRSRLDRPAHPRHARRRREDRLGRRGGQGRHAGGSAGPAGRHRPAVPRPDERRILRRSPAALRHRLLPRRRTRLLRPAGNLTTC